MGDLLTTGSVLAAFFAGGVALFAPCCIVFLAPSYLAVAVKNRRWLRFPPDRRGIDNEDRDAREAEEVRPGVP